MSEIVNFTQKLISYFNSKNAIELDITYQLVFTDFSLDNNIFIRIKNEHCSFFEEQGNLIPNTILRANQNTWHRIIQNEITPQFAYMTGKLFIEGNILFAIQLSTIFNDFQEI